MKKIIALFSVLSIFTYTNLFSQLTVKDQDPKGPYTLLQVNDEGSAGSITLFSLSSIGTPTNKLYNIGSSLFWNGTALGTAESAGGWSDDGSVIRLSNSADKVGISGYA